MKEQWKDIAGYESVYRISNLGRVKSLSRKIELPDGSIKRIRSRILRPGISHWGYPYVSLSFRGKQKSFLVHLLVIRHFGEERPSDSHQCNHKDTNKLNPRIDNLEWATPSENMEHAFRSGLQNQVTSGSDHHSSKVTEYQVQEIRRLAMQQSQKSLAEEYGLSQGQISKIVNRKAWA